jgi:hypothetical protein
MNIMTAPEDLFTRELILAVNDWQRGGDHGQKGPARSASQGMRRPASRAVPHLRRGLLSSDAVEKGLEIGGEQ